MTTYVVGDFLINPNKLKIEKGSMTLIESLSMYICGLLTNQFVIK